MNPSPLPRLQSFQMWAESPPPQEQTWWGWQGVLCSNQRTWLPPNRALQLNMVHFVEELPEWNRLGMGTGMNPTR